MVPGRVADGTRRHPGRPGLEAGDERAQEGGQADDGHLRARAAAAEGLLPVAPGQQRGGGQQRERRGGDRQEEGDGRQLEVPADPPEVRVQGVGVQDGGDDDNDERAEDAEVRGPEEDPQRGMPPERRLLRPEDALGEEQVDDVEDQDAGVDEYGRRQREAHVALSRGPGDAQYQSSDPRHAKAEQDTRYEELVVAPLVDLQNRHICRRRADE